MHVPALALPLRLLTATAALTLGLLTARAAENTFTATPQQSLEAKALVRLLEQVHYNRDSVKPADYKNIVGDYMKALDGQRLFFLAPDRAELDEKFPADSLYWNLTALGRLDPAFDVFRVYETRARDRAQWIFERLDGEFDLTADESYLLDRKEAPWPADRTEADALWERRVKFELLQEVLNDKTLDEAKSVVRKRYERLVRTLEDFESIDLIERFLGTITQMYDPHSTYFSSDTFEDFSINMRLQLFGIGALLSLEDDLCVIKEIIPGGPADLGRQLKPNDKIIAVAQDDAEPVEIFGMKLRKIVEMIRGPKDTKVRLVIQPADAADSSARREITITRDVVNLDSARAYGAVFQVPASADEAAADSPAPAKTRPIGVITLPAFYGPDLNAESKQNSASEDVAELIKRLQSQGIDGLVLDLRGNGGGLLSEAIALTGLFIKDGPVVQVRSYYGDVKVDSDEDPAVAYDGPLVVLTSRFSASASEIVAGALQNYGRAVIIGDTSTHGKGSVQTVIEMNRVLSNLLSSDAKAGATKLTIQKFYLPNGASTQLKGVVPDIVLPSVEEFLPIGESDLPHALAWDEIPSSLYDGRPYTPATLQPLVEASLDRQQSLEEFSLLRKNIDRFRDRQAEKTVSLNLDERQARKAADTTYREEVKEERKRLEEALAYSFEETLLAPPPAPRIKAEDDDDESADALDSSEDEHFPKLDIPLRESLRVVVDMLETAVPAQEPVTPARQVTKTL
ncbi:MAG: carboxy terminal-processing peptidase [Verrucomicrobiota bacterium]